MGNDVPEAGPWQQRVSPQNAHLQHSARASSKLGQAHQRQPRPIIVPAIEVFPRQIEGPPFYKVPDFVSLAVDIGHVLELEQPLALPR